VYETINKSESYCAILTLWKLYILLCNFVLKIKMWLFSEYFKLIFIIGDIVKFFELTNIGQASLFFSFYYLDKWTMKIFGKYYNILTVLSFILILILNLYSTIYIFRAFFALGDIEKFLQLKTISQKYIYVTCMMYIKE
jgi:hypothetical protein